MTLRSGEKGRFARELSWFNAVCCLLVILIHVLSLGISSADPASWQLAVIYFPWRLAAFVVPAFLFSGGVKLAMSFTGREEGYGRYLLGRVKKIYLPYLLWTVIYFLCFLPIGYVRGELVELWGYILAGNITSPFYYILITMQFYLLRPVWRWLVERVSWPMGLLLSVLVTLASLQGNNFLGQFGLSFGYWDRVFTSYLLFWVMGLYVGRHYESFAQALDKERSGLLWGGLMVLVQAFLAYIQYARKVWFFDQVASKLFTDCISILILLWLCRALREGRLTRVLDYIHRASFFVYLSHCLFLTLGNAFMVGLGVNDLSVLLAGRFVICYTMPFAAYELWRRFRKSVIK